MSENNILICHETVGIGGVETAVLNKALAFKKKGCNVFIMAKDGVYRDVIEAEGIELIDFTYELTDFIDMDKVSKIVKIIKEKKISQVHIHQYPCLPYVGFACLITGIPYNLYIHSGDVAIEPTFQWYIDTFDIQKSFFKIFIEHAYKIITVTSKAINITQKFFGLDNTNKFIIERNCIDVDRYTNKTKVKQLKRFLIVSRLAEEKYDSIKNGIDFYKEYSKYNEDCILTIVGDGEIREKLKSYVKSINMEKYISFVGETNNVKDFIENCDVVIAMGRCILEAISMKRLAIICNEEGIKGIVDKNNIERAIESNFTLRRPYDEKGELIQTEELIKSLKLYNQYKIDALTEENHRKITECLDIMNNSYYISNEELNEYSIDKSKIISDILMKYENLENDYCKIKEENKRGIITFDEERKKVLEKDAKIKELEDRVKECKELYNQKCEECEAKQKAIDEILDSKRWKISSKIIGIFKRK